MENFWTFSREFRQENVHDFNIKIAQDGKWQLCQHISADGGTPVASIILQIPPTSASSEVN